MKIDRFGIDPEQLRQHVNDEYGLAMTSLSFLPKGEEVGSANYLSEGQDGERFLIKAQDAADRTRLETVYEILNAVRVRAGLEQVVAPIRNRGGSFTFHMGSRAVAVFPYVEGISIWDSGRSLDGEGWARAARMMAGLHRSPLSLEDELLQGAPRETFENPFAVAIRRALIAATWLDPWANAYQRRVRQLLLAERDGVLALLETLEQLRMELSVLTTDQVLTHGDPNLANILVDASGNLHLIDWGELAVGPPERDLWMFTDKPQDFLRSYLATYGRLRLHGQLIRFYHFRWAAQEIADYSTRILFGKATEAEDEHAWEELQPYLPVRFVDIEAGVNDAAAAVLRAEGEWV
jgi:spectinomycin phosphotransferase